MWELVVGEWEAHNHKDEWEVDDVRKDEWEMMDVHKDAVESGGDKEKDDVVMVGGGGHSDG